MKLIFFILLSVVQISLFAQTFSTKQIYFNEGGGTQGGIDAVDFDNDGLKDILMASANPNVFWVKNLGNNTFGPKIELFDEEIFGERARAIDINKDGNMDIAAICSFSNVVITIMGNGDGTFKNAVVLEQIPEPMTDLLVYDVNRDGFDDLIYSTYSASDDIGKIYWNKNDGNGSFLSRRTIIDEVLDVHNLLFADLNGDQLPDLIVKTKWEDKFLWCKNEGNDNFSLGIELRQPILSLGGQVVDAKDIDKDGDIDLITYENDDLAIYVNDGVGNFTSRVVPCSSWMWDFAVSDFNHDGNMDIFTGHGTNKGAVILYGKDDGTFREEISLATNIGQITDIKIVDMDNDGVQDVVTASSLYDGYLLFINEYNGPTINTANPQNDVVKMYPNPTTDFLIIESKDQTISFVEIYNIHGQKITERQVENTHKIEFSISDLVTGTYAVIIKDSFGRIISKQKIVKQ